MTSDGTVWTVTGEFAVCLPEGWTPVCAEHLPVLVRRVFRHRQAARAPIILPGDGSPCRVVQPHPAPGSGVPIDGATCPRPLTGLCLSGSCDHD
jgi:hypothetical protein